MSFGQIKCESCGRNSYTTPDGETKELEVCFSNAHQMWCCKRCYFAVPAKDTQK